MPLAVALALGAWRIFGAAHLVVSCGTDRMCEVSKLSVTRSVHGAYGVQSCGLSLGRETDDYTPNALAATCTIAAVERRVAVRQESQRAPTTVRGVQSLTAAQASEHVHVARPSRMCT